MRFYLNSQIVWKTGAEFEIESTVSDHWKGIRVEAITLKKKKSAGFLNFIIKSEEVKKKKEKKENHKYAENSAT